MNKYRVRLRGGEGPLYIRAGNMMQVFQILAGMGITNIAAIAPMQPWLSWDSDQAFIYFLIGG